MALRFHNRGNCPSGQFRVLCKETGVWLTGIDWNQFESVVKNHFRANSIPIGLKFEDWLEDQACRNTDPSHCYEEGYGTAFPAKAPTTFQQLKTGTLTLLEWFRKGKERVDIEEATKRAGACVTCAYNQPALNCPSCMMSSVTNIVDEIVGGHTTVHDSKLWACRLCGCSLKAKIHLPMEVIRKHEPEFVTNQYPPHCWLKP